MAISEKETGHLRDFKEKVLRAFPHRIKGITLFGSRATGRGGKHSDLMSSSGWISVTGTLSILFSIWHMIFTLTAI